MGQFFNSINEVRKNYSKYDVWEQAQADECAQKEYLAANLDIPKDKLELAQKRAEVVIHATEIMDARSEDNCENMEQLTGILSIFPILGIQFGQMPLLQYLEKKNNAKLKSKVKIVENDFLASTLTREAKDLKIKDLLNKSRKMSKKINNYVTFGSLALMLVSAVGMILWGNSKQKDASRIGRYQAKQNELQDLKNFVVYVPEQTEKAKEIAKNIPDEKERNSISKMIKELKAVSKDKKAYKEWLAQKNPQEIEKLKTVNLSPAQLEKAEEDKELIVDAVKEINIKAEEYSENVENAFDTMENVSWLAAAPLGFGLNKLLNALKVDKKWRSITSVAVPVLTTIIIQLMGTVEQKKASRVGRYKARQDLLKNPARLMSYSEEDMKKVENVKASKQKQSFFKKLGGSFSFISKYYKDKSEYTKYKKTTQKENEKFQKALKEIEVTDAQKTEAKALQKNLFRAFDEIDEMSQRYSEDTEAGCDIAKQIGSTVWTLGTIGAMAWLSGSIAKGKFPITKLANKLTNMTFDAKSPIKKAVNNLNDVLKAQEKTKTQEFQKAIVGGELNDFIRKPENKAITDAITLLMEEFGKIGANGMVQITAGTCKKDATAIFSELFSKHLKQTRLAKWTRNMLAQCSKLWVKSKVSKAEVEIPKEVQEKMGMNFSYNNYKTLINTGLIAGVPVLGIIVAVPYAFNAWLTSIQKKAGKIGIMKAMEKIDDPRVFASEQQLQPEAQNMNMLNKLKQPAV